MLPNPHHPPPLPPKFPIDLPVPCPVRIQFPFPEGAVVFGLGVMLWAAVPETAIHKDSHTTGRKNKIRASHQRPFPPPAGDLVLSEQGYHAQFGFQVARPANPRHAVTTLLGSQNIGHDRNQEFRENSAQQAFNAGGPDVGQTDRAVVTGKARLERFGKRGRKHRQRFPFLE